MLQVSNAQSQFVIQGPMVRFIYIYIYITTCLHSGLLLNPQDPKNTGPHKVAFMKVTMKSHKQQLEAFRPPLLSAIADFPNPP